MAFFSKKFCLLMCGFVLAWSHGGLAAVICVDAAATGAGTGASWDDAFVDLQAALAAAQAGDEIWVAQGIYRPGPVGDTTATFHLVNDVGVYGGFFGTETERDQRDWVQWPTVLSGDIGADDVYGDVVWYIGWNINTSNSEHVVTASGNDASAVLDGFTVMAGYNSYGYGGGYYSIEGSATVTHCTFTRNLAGFSHGGGAYLSGGATVFSDCTFVENYVHLGEGGAVYLYGDAPMQFLDCAFVDNICVGAGSGGQGVGGAISSWSDADWRVERCLFERNTASNFYPSGSYSGTYAGAIDHFGDGLLTVLDSSFVDNESNNGGAIYNWGNALIVNSLFYGNDAPEYSTSSGGWGGGGGAIECLSFFGSNTDLINCTIVGNYAEHGGGVSAQYDAVVNVVNSIVWDNSDNKGQIGISQVSGGDCSYSCIMKMLVPEPGEDPPEPGDFPGCIDADPTLVDVNGKDVHLEGNSPCIDAADNAQVPIQITTDFDGNPRFVDVAEIPDTGNGTPPIVDMGAFEFQILLPVCEGDVNGDGVVDPLDSGFVLARFGCAVGTGDLDCDAADANADGVVDPLDVGFVLARFGNCE